jgi:prepilin-type processing-associated H-X9-DG protein
VLGQTPLPGCSENHGINNPLQSRHGGGVQVGMVDGSVQFILDTIDLEVLLRLAIRNDGVTPSLAPP